MDPKGARNLDLGGACSGVQSGHHIHHLGQIPAVKDVYRHLADEDSRLIILVQQRVATPESHPGLRWHSLQGQLLWVCI